MGKAGKKLTRNQKAIVQGHGLDISEWRFVKNVGESYIQVININTGKKETLDVYKKSKNKYDY